LFAADKKGTQRERLLDAMVHCTAQEGYLGTTITKVIARAGVSRPTFYDYFTNKDDCFLAALAQSEQRASAAVERALSDAPADRAVASTIGSLIAFANSEPAHARVLFSEALAGRAGALDSRDRWIDSTAGLIEDAYARLPPTARLPDLSSAKMSVSASARSSARSTTALASCPRARSCSAIAGVYISSSTSFTTQASAACTLSHAAC
jgi:AcrR family transcriptional regulator